jgi:type II secretory pathway component PulM
MKQLAAQATQWWSSREPRERWMLAIMFILISAFTLWYGVLVPLNKMCLASQRAYDQAAAELQTIQQEVHRLQGAVAKPVSAARIESSAKAFGLNLQRDAQAAGPLAFHLKDASAEALFGWLDMLGDEGAAPIALRVIRSSDGLQVRVVFAGVAP